MENSQITNVCNDREDNDLKSLGKGHSSLTHKIHNEIGIKREEHLKAHIRTFISNYLKKTTLNGQYTHSKEKDIVYIQNICFFFSFFFPTHTLNIKKMSSIENT